MKPKESFVGKCPNCNAEPVEFKNTDIKEVVECSKCNARMGRQSLTRVLQV